MTVFKEFPAKDELLNWYKKTGNNVVREVNAHFHTPFSFSAFKNIEEVFELANKENVEVLGINDFFVADGYDEFYSNCLKNNKFPLFNIEFIGLLKEEMKKGMRINDPNNPGRTYFSGKGLDYPFNLPGKFAKRLEELREETQVQVKEMTRKAAALLQALDSDIVLDFDTMKKKYAKKLVRERHIAKAIREVIYDKYLDDIARKDFLEKLYDKTPKSPVNDHAATENEIRGNLLKAGGKAFVAEDERSFLEIDKIKSIILNAGGIPCYPVLLDDKDGNITEFEADKEQLLEKLVEYGVYCIELIPGRNDADILEDFVKFFDDQKFIILLGTEHNTPDLIPLSITTRGGHPLSPYLKKVNYEGACVLAAHQYLRARGEKGYIHPCGTAARDSKNEFVELGKAVIERFINM